MVCWGEASPTTEAPPEASLFQSCGLIPRRQNLKERPLASPGRGQAIWLKQEKIHIRTFGQRFTTRVSYYGLKCLDHKSRHIPAYG